MSVEEELLPSLCRLLPPYPVGLHLCRDRSRCSYRGYMLICLPRVSENAVLSKAEGVYSNSQWAVASSILPVTWSKPTALEVHGEEHRQSFPVISGT